MKAKEKGKHWGDPFIITTWLLAFSGFYTSSVWFILPVLFPSIPVYVKLITVIANILNALYSVTSEKWSNLKIEDGEDS
jgi:hypothetical protein